METKELQLEISSLAATLTLGAHLAQFLNKGMVIALRGNLGAGKTTFTSGIANGLGIKEKVLSPSFNIMRCYYKGNIHLYHIDAYRLEDGVNSEIGLEEFIDGDGIAVVEWPQYIAKLIPVEHLSVDIMVRENEKRLFFFKGYGHKYVSLIEYLKGVIL